MPRTMPANQNTSLSVERARSIGRKDGAADAVEGAPYDEDYSLLPPVFPSDTHRRIAENRRYADAYREGYAAGYNND